MAGPLDALDVLAATLSSRRPLRVELNDAIRAAVSVVLTPGHSGLELLLIRRAERQGDPWSGDMALPGGRMDVEDDGLCSTARRETLEETAVDLLGATLLGELDDLHSTTAELPRIVVRPFVFGIDPRPMIRSNHEVAGHLWAPLRELHAARAESEVVVRGRSRLVPSYRLGADVIWGMTHRILDPLVQLGAEP